MPRPTVTDLRALEHALRHPGTPLPPRSNPDKLTARGLLRPAPTGGYTITEAGQRAYITENLPPAHSCHGILWVRTRLDSHAWAAYLPGGTYTLTKDPGLPHRWVLAAPDGTSLGASSARALGQAADELFHSLPPEEVAP